MSYDVKRRNLQPRYYSATETGNNLIAASQNISSSQRYLDNIIFPYFQPSEIVTLNTACGNVYVDMMTDGRDDRRSQLLITWWWYMVVTNKSPLLVSYLFSIGDPRHPSPLCPLCLMHDHTSSHLFECKSLPTSLSSLDLWTNPDKVEPFLATWGERLLAATCFRVLDSAGSTLVEWSRQQQQQPSVIMSRVQLFLRHL